MAFSIDTVFLLVFITNEAVVFRSTINDQLTQLSTVEEITRNFKFATQHSTINTIVQLVVTFLNLNLTAWFVYDIVVFKIF